MKVLVVYQSATGFTRRYAEWIAEDLGCKAVELKKVSAKEAASCDCLVYGGWLMGNTISGLKKLQNMSPGRLCVFAVGVTPDSVSYQKVVREYNHLENLPFFYMEGGIHYDKLGMIKKMMLKAVSSSLAKKPGRTEQELIMANRLCTNFDNTDRKFVKELVEAVRGLEQVGNK